MKKLISLILVLCLLTIPLMSLTEERIAQTPPAVHRQD